MLLSPKSFPAISSAGLFRKRRKRNKRKEGNHINLTGVMDWSGWAVIRFKQEANFSLHQHKLWQGQAGELDGVGWVT